MAKQKYIVVDGAYIAYSGLIDGDKIQQASAGLDADYFVLKTAERKHVKIVTNDRYNENQKRFPCIEKARVPVMIVGGEVILHKPSLKED